MSSIIEMQTEIVTLQLRLTEMERQLAEFKEIMGRIPKKKLKNADEIVEAIDRKLLLQQYQISPHELELVILRAKEWLLDNPDKGAKSSWTLRTGRVQTFLDKYPKKTNENKPRIV